MDIRQNPINPSAAPLPSARADLPPSAGQAASAPIPPALPPPIPSVVALSEAARSLAARSPSLGADGQSGDEVDFAALQLELMLDLLRVYTPPPPMTPQELAESVAEEVAAERERQAPAESDPGFAPAAEVDASTAAAVSTGEASAQPFVDEADSRVAADEPAESAAGPAVAAAETLELRRAQLYSEADRDGGNAPRINVSA
jgi:hypothetical protein